MNVYWPVFGFPDDQHVCKKWFVLAENAKEAFEKAQHQFDMVAPNFKAYWYPTIDWNGPLFAVEQARVNDNSVCHLG